jgi:hypothetical protein
MAVELDHIFLLVSVGAPEADLLSALGLTEGQPNRHPGQGTACRRFFFANAYLELLWVEDPAEVQGEVARPLRFFERWSQRAGGACPFGLVFRLGQEAVPFSAWEYRPPYLPPPQGFHMGVNSDCVEEPLLVCFQGGRRPDARPAQSRQPLEHQAGLREVTALRIHSPRTAFQSAALRAAVQTGTFALLPGPTHLAEIGFDGEHKGKRADLRPAMPIVLCW